MVSAKFQVVVAVAAALAFGTRGQNIPPLPGSGGAGLGGLFRMLEGFKIDGSER